MQESAHIRKVETRSFSGTGGAVIFSLRYTDAGQKDITDRIIRLFAENSVPLDIAISASVNGNRKENTDFLIQYTDAGIVDINVDGHDVSWVDPDLPDAENTHANIKSQLARARWQIEYDFGTAPVACLVPEFSINKENYQVLQEADYKVLAVINTVDLPSSRQSVDWSGNEMLGGLYRLPIVATANYVKTSPVTKISKSEIVTITRDINEEIISAANSSIDSLGIAVIEIRPGDFLDQDNNINNTKIQQLNTLIRSIQQIGEIITFNGWDRYATKYIEVVPVTKRLPQNYHGGPAVIFRLDDVSKGWYEDTVEEIIKLFKRNGVPLDLGILANVEGTDSFAIPWLKKYIDDGDVGVSVHGWDWTYYQLDTTQSHMTYDDIKFKMLKARDQYLQYFGVAPVAFTVPTDYYDETGYRAIDDAGFKIFATHSANETNPSNIPVDFSGRKDPNGMYRIPTGSDVCEWDEVNQTWGDVIDISKPAGIQDYCRYHNAWTEVIYN
ncbi:MAG: polysaccharide deacetylase family protein, partial [Dehalococcoidia bacterium]|nr:polysaccharide deacetylase family protein [Dehalococcoidia bacterium]